MADQLMEVDASMVSRLRSLSTLAYFGSRENFGTESYDLSAIRYLMPRVVKRLTLAISLKTLLCA